MLHMPHPFKCPLPRMSPKLLQTHMSLHLLSRTWMSAIHTESTWRAGSTTQNPSM